MKVILTGASGFIGRQMYPLLKADGHNVIPVVYNNPIFQDSYKVDLLELSPTTIKEHLKDLKADALIHMAWYASPRDYKSSVENLKWLSKSLDLVRLFYETGGKKVITAGTCFEYTFSISNQGSYFGTSTGEGAAEHYIPHTLYGMCKRAMYQSLAKFVYKEALDYAHARIFHVFGPYEYPARLVPSVANALLRGERPKCSMGIQERNFLYVEDVARAITQLVGAIIPGKAINIGSSDKVRIKDLVERIGLYLNRPDMVDFADTLDPEDPLSLCPDTGLLEMLTHFKPKYTLNQGLALTLDWIRENYKDK